MKFPDRPVLIDPCNGVNKPTGLSKNLIRSWLTVLLVGLIALVIGLRPDIFGLDRGLYIGFYQILLILFGIGLMTLGASNMLKAFWGCDEKPLLVDIGSRMVATGYVICFFTALADAFGFGTNPPPEVLLGTLQSRGVIIGMIVICAGLIMMVRFKIPEDKSLTATTE
jgi:hypothetical protein